MTIGHNTLSGRVLLGFIERIEALKKNRDAVTDDMNVVFAEAKGHGLSRPGIQAMIKARAMTPARFREGEDLRDMYLHAIGMAEDPPLFKYLASIKRDGLGRDKLIEHLKEMVPDGVSITMEMGGAPLRISRDKDGTVTTEEVKPEFTPVWPGSDARGTPPMPPSAPVPDTDEDGAEALGRADAKANKPIIVNPFPFGDKRRARWDKGWRQETNNDGMGPDEDD